jgi:hypothetical protein
MHILRYKLTLGNDVGYFSSTRDWNRSDIINRISHLPPNIFDILIDWESISKKSIRVSSKTFLTRIENSTDGSEIKFVLDLNKIKINLVNFYDGYVNKESVFNHFIKKSIGYQEEDVLVLSRLLGISIIECISQIQDLVESNILETVYSSNGQNWYISSECKEEKIFIAFRVKRADL